MAPVSFDSLVDGLMLAHRFKILSRINAGFKLMAELRWQL
jgi:hypothetical protein